MAEPVSRAGATLAAPSSALALSPLLVAVCLAFCIAVLAALLVWRLKRRPAAVAAAAAAAKAPAVPALAPGLPQPPSTPDPSLPQPLSATQTAEVAAALARTSPASPASPPPQEPLPPPLAPPALPRKLVRAALPDGEHHVQFGDGSAYYGEWRGGRMHGRGVFEWPTGERWQWAAVRIVLACPHRVPRSPAACCQTHCSSFFCDRLDRATHAHVLHLAHCCRRAIRGGVGGWAGERHSHVHGCRGRHILWQLGGRPDAR